MCKMPHPVTKTRRRKIAETASITIWRLTVFPAIIVLSPAFWILALGFSKGNLAEANEMTLLFLVIGWAGIPRDTGEHY